MEPLVKYIPCKKQAFSREIMIGCVMSLKSNQLRDIDVKILLDKQFGIKREPGYWPEFFLKLHADDANYYTSTRVFMLDLYIS